MSNCGFVLTVVLAFSGCRVKGKNTIVDSPTTSPTLKEVEIRPKHSIGEVVLGAKVEQLPGRAVVSGSTGILDAIHFEIDDGRIRDVWIEDLRTFPLPVLLDGRVIYSDISLADLKALLGPCENVPVKGGVFFNCARGVTIGSDPGGQGQFIQLRLQPR